MHLANYDRGIYVFQVLLRSLVQLAIHSYVAAWHDIDTAAACPSISIKNLVKPRP